VTVICHRLQRTLTPEYCHVAGKENPEMSLCEMGIPGGQITNNQLQ